MSSEQDKIREQVSEAYAQAVKKPAGGCCGSGSLPKGVAAMLAGYSTEELMALPPEAVVNSFGCGNPLHFSEVKAGQTVLDLGSGAGIDILIAGKKVGPSGRVIGIDMTDAMIARARENIAAAGLTNVEVRKGIIEAMPIEANTVDWVISNCVINLSPDKPRVFAEIFRVLKPGGWISISDIVVKELPDWVRQSPALYSSCVAGAISEDEYLAGLRRVGLADVAVRERLVYDAAMLEGFVLSEVSGAECASGCCGSGVKLEGVAAAKIVKDLEGKIWSAKFAARKP